MEARARVLLAATLVLLVGLVAVPSALAVSATVRVEAAPFTVAPPTKVDVAPTDRFFDASGTPYRPGYPSALGALAAAGERRGFSFEAAYGGDFITNIAGFTALPDWSQGWIYAVNGAGYPVVDVGALSFELRKGDRVLFTQYPSANFDPGYGTEALQVSIMESALLTGDPLVVTVVGDDLKKANSLSDAARFDVGVDFVETPDQFAPVAGAVVHVGTATYLSDANGVVTIVAPPAGTSCVWAEREADGASAYIRSAKALVNVADALVLSDLTVTPRTFSRGQRVSIKFAVSRSARVKYTVRSGSGRLVAALTRRVAGGSVAMGWDGHTAAGNAVRPGRYTIRVTAVDTWGRTAKALSATVVAR